MPKFVFVFRGGTPDTPEAGQKMLADWDAWLTGMGDAVVDPGAAVGASAFVDAMGKEAPAKDPVSGYMVVETTDLQAAIANAKACPIRTAGGTIEVAPVVML
ncbi:MAG TPA: YciI family protein [Devosia sp.]|jgi:hypothetical protein|nr:YciI family protein [Devosia sp.]